MSWDLDRSTVYSRWAAIDRERYPDPVSKIHAAARRAVEAYRITSYAAYGFQIRIYPGWKPSFTNQEPVIDPDDDDAEQFRLISEDLSTSVNVKMRVARDNADIVEIWWVRYARGLCRSGWVAFAEYLKAQPMLHDPNTCLNPATHCVNELFHARLDHQRKWWQENGLRFKFDKLPLEIRNLIHGYSLGTTIQPYKYCPSRRTQKLPATEWICGHYLRICKVMSEEMLELIYTVMPFEIVTKRILMKTMINPHFPFHRLKKMTLTLTHVEYFKFFGLKTIDVADLDDLGEETEDDDGVSDDGSESVMSRAESADQRGTYEEDFEHDAVTTWYRGSDARFNFWNMHLKSLTINMPDPVEMFNTDFFSRICQKNAVELILRAAWQFIRGQPVTLTGFIKRDQKAIWEAKFRDEVQERRECEDYQRYAEEMGEVPEVLPFRESVIHVALPIHCLCGSPCQVKWTEDDDQIDFQDSDE